MPTLVQTLASNLAARHLLEKVCSGFVARDSSEYDTAQERRTAKSVCTVHASCNFARSIETFNRLALGINDAGSCIDFKTSHPVESYISLDSLHDTDIAYV